MKFSTPNLYSDTIRLLFLSKIIFLSRIILSDPFSGAHPFLLLFPSTSVSPVVPSSQSGAHEDVLVDEIPSKVAMIIFNTKMKQRVSPRSPRVELKPK